jgi:hypothetical protein
MAPIGKSGETEKPEYFFCRPKLGETKEKLTSVGSIRKDSILLGIFAGEREDSIQKSKNRFRIGHHSFAKIGKNPHPEFWRWFDKQELNS